MKGVNSGMFVNMNETAVRFDNDHNHTFNEKGAKTVSERHGSSANKRCTVCITVAADGTKLLTCYFQRCYERSHSIILAGRHSRRNLWLQKSGRLDGELSDAALDRENMEPYVGGSTNSVLLFV